VLRFDDAKYKNPGRGPEAMEKPRVIEYSAHESITSLLYGKGPTFRTRYSNPTAGGLGTSDANATYIPYGRVLIGAGCILYCTHTSEPLHVYVHHEHGTCDVHRAETSGEIYQTRLRWCAIIIYNIQRRRTAARASFLFRRPRRIYNIIYCTRGPRDSGALPSFRGCAFFFLSPAPPENSRKTLPAHITYPRVRAR